MRFGLGKVRDLVNTGDGLYEIFENQLAMNPFPVLAQMPMGEQGQLFPGVVERASVDSTLARKAFFRNQFVGWYNLHDSFARFVS